MNRNLDTVYSRVKRGEKYKSICFSDLTEEEQEKFMDRLDYEGLRALCGILAQDLKKLGDSLDIVGGEE